MLRTEPFLFAMIAEKVGRLINDMLTYFFIKPLCLAFKAIGYILCYTLAFVLAVVFLPFYGIFHVCGGDLPKERKSKKKDDSDDLSWIDRIEEYDAMMH